MTATGAGAENGLIRARPVDPVVELSSTVVGGPAEILASGVPGSVQGSAHLVWRAVLVLVLGVAAMIVAVLLLRHGVSTDEFPPFLDGTSQTAITRYSGPWITAGAGVALLAALLLLFALIDAVRWWRTRPGAAT